MQAARNNNRDKQKNLYRANSALTTNAIIHNLYAFDVCTPSHVRS